MIFEKHYSLTAAARLVGVARKTMKRWLAQDCGIIVPRVRHGGKVLIRERDIQRVVEKRRDARAS